MTRHADETAKLIKTKDGSIIQTQPYKDGVELSVFDSGNRITVSYLTGKEISELVELLEETF